MSNIVQINFETSPISFNESGWINATDAARRFGKSAHEWVRLASTKEYIAALESTYGEIPYVKTSRARQDRGGGTWLHPKLAVVFARWLSVEFSVWCDAQIDKIIRGEHESIDWKAKRHAAASTNKVLNMVIQNYREESGKETKHYHYSNEARMINYILTGEFKAVDRSGLSLDELDLLARLETKNMVLISRGVPYEDRKSILKEFSNAYKSQKLIVN